MKELDSNFTWDVKLLLDLDSSPGLGSPSIGIGFQPTTLDVMPEMGFQKKRTITRKMTLVTQETQLFRPITDKQMDIGCLENWILQHKVRGRTFISMGSISELEIRLCIIFHVLLIEFVAVALLNLNV